MKKKLTLSIVLVVALAVVLAFSASAETGTYTSTEDGNTYTYEVENNEITITGYEGTLGDSVIIPEVITHNESELAVVAIGDNAFVLDKANRYSTPSTLDLGSVKHIGASAFQHWSNLTSLVIPNTVETIGESGFNSFTENNSKGKLKSIVFQEGSRVTEIKAETFANSCHAINELVLPENLVSIGKAAFSVGSKNIALTTVDLPPKLQTIGDNAFWNYEGCTSLEIPDSVQTIGSLAFAQWDNLASLDLGNGVQTIGAYAFKNGNAADTGSMTKFTGTLTIPDSVKTIGDQAFYQWSAMTGLNIGSSVETIGNSAFYGCKKLNGITIPASVTSIGEAAFSSCGNSTLTSIEFIDTQENPSSLKTIPANAFYESVRYLTELKLPNSVESVGDNAFKSLNKISGLTSLDLPDNLKTIGVSGFENFRAVTSLEIPVTVTSIGDSAFYKNSLRALTILGSPTIGSNAFEITDTLDPDTNASHAQTLSLGSTTSIGNSAFANWRGLSSITIPDSVTSIGESAFFNCRWIETLSIGENVSTIGYKAFVDGRRLESITVSQNNQYFTSNGYCLVDVTNATVITGCNGNNITIPAGVKKIGDYAFYYRQTLTGHITIPDGVTEIGAEAFDGAKISSVKLPKSLQTVGVNGFPNNDNLKNGHVYYEGTKAEYDSVDINASGNNNIVAYPEIHYNSCMYTADHMHTGTWVDSDKTSTLTCSAEGCGNTLTLKINTASVVLGDDFSVNFKVDKSMFECGTFTDMSMTITFNGETVSSYVDDGTYYVFTIDGISPDELGDNISATLNAKYGNTAIDATKANYSIKTYCQNQLEKGSPSDTERALIVALLNYGAAAQDYVGDSNDRVNNILTGSDLTVGDPDFTSVPDVSVSEFTGETKKAAWKSAGLVLTDKITVRLKFVTSGAIDNMSVQVTGVASTSRIVNAGNNTYYVYIDDINPSQMRETIQATVYSGENAVSGTLTYTIATYAMNKINGNGNIAALVKAMMVYGDAAAAYVA